MRPSEVCSGCGGVQGLSSACENEVRVEQVSSGVACSLVISILKDTAVGSVKVRV
jgi:hypothetical protein